MVKQTLKNILKHNSQFFGKSEQRFSHYKTQERVFDNSILLILLGVGLVEAHIIFELDVVGIFWAGIAVIVLSLLYIFAGFLYYSIREYLNPHIDKRKKKLATYLKTQFNYYNRYSQFTGIKWSIGYRML